MARPATVVIGAGVVGCRVVRELAARDLAVSMPAGSHAHYAELRQQQPGAPIYPVGAPVISGRADGPGDGIGRR